MPEYPRQRQLEERASQVWDAVARGTAPDIEAFDPSLLETMRRLQAVGAQPHPDSGFASRLEAALLQAHAGALFDQLHQLRLGTTMPNGRTVPPASKLTPKPVVFSMRKQWLASLATAALVLLTVVGGFLALRGLWRHDSHDAQPMIIPAWESTPESTPEVTPPPQRQTTPASRTNTGLENTLLMQGTFEVFPKLATWQGIARATLAPGTEFSLGASENDGEGPMLYRVEFGELTVNADGPISITRNGATTVETVPAGTDAVLQEGDQGLTPSGVKSRWRNERKVPAVILDAGFSTSGYGDLPAGVTHDAIVSKYTDAPNVPVSVSVRRLTLQPRQALGPRDLLGVQLLYVESGAVDVIDTDQLDVSSDIFAIGPKSKPGQTVTAGSAYPGVIPAGGGFRVRGSDPATVLVMTVVDANGAAGSPMS